MTIEVRQLVIKAQVGMRPAAGTPSREWLRQQREELKKELMAECREWLARQLRQHRER
jgi:hypothetical protein